MRKRLDIAHSRSLQAFEFCSNTNIVKTFSCPIVQDRKFKYSMNIHLKAMNKMLINIISLSDFATCRSHFWIKG